MPRYSMSPPSPYAYAFVLWARMSFKPVATSGVRWCDGICFLERRIASHYRQAPRRQETLQRDKPKFHYADLHRNFPDTNHESRDSRTQTVKVADTNHKVSDFQPSRHVEVVATKSVQVRDKSVCVASMEFSS